ncbi:MAG: T9SS type A sorting domain-containing protein [Bacteroidota bacterium]
MKKLLLYIALFFCAMPAGFCQNFNFLYGGSTDDWGIDVIETYDRGYVILSTLDGQYARILVTKIEINGNILWQKIIGNVSDKLAPSSILETSDLGYLITGEEAKYDPPPPGGNSFAMKLNECGEIEWTKSYGSFGNMDYITKAVQTDDKGFAMLANYIDNKRIVLLKIDSVGHLEFKKHYHDTSNSSGWSLKKCMNGDLLFSGYGYFQNPGGVPAGWWVRSIVTRVDKNGNEKWNYIVKLDTLFKTLSMQCIELQDSSILCGTTYRDANHHQKPYMLKLSKDGNLIWGKFVGDTTGFDADINGLCMMDTTRVFLMSGKFYDPVYKGVFLYRTDTSGAFVDTVWYDNQYTCWPGNLKAVSNHKLIYCGTQDNGGNYQAQIIRLREDLSIDTVLNISLNYDSLCGHVIPAIEYLPFDTNYHVGVETALIEKDEVWLYPNPNDGHFTISINSSETEEAIIEITDIAGKLLIREKYGIAGNKTISLPYISSGVYLCRVETKYSTVIRKFIVRKP